jgi:mannose-6-phosphate isomerase-like protein (cupin superfamily)
MRGGFVVSGIGRNGRLYRRRRPYRMEVEGRRFQLDAGQGLEVPPGRVHVVHATEASALELLVISAPSSRGDRRAA